MGPTALVPLLAFFFLFVFGGDNLALSTEDRLPADVNLSGSSTTRPLAWKYSRTLIWCGFRQPVSKSLMYLPIPGNNLSLILELQTVAEENTTPAATMPTRIGGLLSRKPSGHSRRYVDDAPLWLAWLAV